MTKHLNQRKKVRLAIGIDIKAGIIEKAGASAQSGPSLAHVSRDDVRRGMAIDVEGVLEIAAWVIYLRREYRPPAKNLPRGVAAVQQLQRAFLANTAQDWRVTTDSDDHYAYVIALYPLSAGCTRPVTFVNISGNRKVRMASKPKFSVTTHRARKQRQGFVRVEVNVRKEDASLIRRVASALSDASRQVEARKLVRQRFAEPPKVSLKALLASAPLDGIDLDRRRDLGG